MRQIAAPCTKKRLELIRYVAAHEELNTRQLAQALSRDYKNVYEDVRELGKYGLLWCIIIFDDRGQCSSSSPNQANLYQTISCLGG